MLHGANGPREKPPNFNYKQLILLLLLVQCLQADNALPDSEHPVVLVLPRPPMQWRAFQRALSSVAPSASSTSRKAAVTMRLAVWRRRPGGGSDKD